jgi:GT2 family glycosyltransferase
MKLAVIIVNYNVKHFLEQCIISAIDAAKQLPCEIYVVDNNSVDGSVEMVRQRFPSVTLIANKDNVGFSKANNQAMRITNAEYVLLLNPDTVVEQDTFTKVVDFMDQHPDAGGLGVKMIDGKGKFLPESKRGLPTPSVAFYKIFGLSNLFPKSKTFSKYHLGYLNNDETHEIEILSGAFMLMRKTTLDKVGLLDEDFFMYGEDIDLSYRIILGGYKNYYYPDTTIIHYKGESTKKSSVNYVFVFYRAMIIFAKKHFSQKNAKLFSFLINVAIYIRASWAILLQTAKKLWLYVFDGLLLAAGLFGIAQQYGSVSEIQFKLEIVLPAIIVYPIIWLITNWYSGGYDQPMSKRKLLKGVFSGTIILLIMYSLMPETLRFSRAVVVLGAFFGVGYYWSSRYLFSWLLPKSFVWKSNVKKRFLLVANQAEINRITELLKSTNIPVEKTIACYPSMDEKPDGYVGNISQWNELLTVHKVDEIIFSAKNLSPNTIMELMASSTKNNIDFKIAPPESMYLIGSNSIHNAGELYMVEANSINQTEQKRNKRLFDLGFSAGCIALLPLVMWFVKHPLIFIKNCLSVLFGTKTWVGFDKNTQQLNKVPNIKKGIISVSITSDAEHLEQINLLYAKNYEASTDWKLCIKHFNYLGGQ